MVEPMQPRFIVVIAALLGGIMGEFIAFCFMNFSVYWLIATIIAVTICALLLLKLMLRMMREKAL